MDPFPWTEQTELAASLIAQGNLSLEDIAARVGVVRRSLYAWRQNPEFKARVDSEIGEFRNEARRIGIATMERRLSALNDRWNRLRRIIEARADDPDMVGVPGGSTGLVIIDQIRGVGEGENFRLISTYAVDTGLLREVREIEKQAAIELGQWQVKIDAGTVDMNEAVRLTQAASDDFVDKDDDDESYLAIGAG